MNRITLSKEARQSLQNARQSAERAIRECKAVTRKPHADGGASAAQSQLSVLKKEATLIYSALAASRRKLHCKVSEERFEALKRKYASEVMRKYMSPTEKLIFELLTAPPPEAAPNASVAA